MGGALALGVTIKGLRQGPASVGIGGSTDTYQTEQTTIILVGKPAKSLVLESLDIMWPPVHASDRVRRDMENIPNLLGVDILQHCKMYYRRRNNRMFMVLEIA